MGSTRSSNFTDYSGTRSNDGAGGTSGIDRCRQAFSCSLEEIELCDYFITHSTVPPVGTELVILHQKRLFAATPQGVKVGALPTSFNYLAACMKDGIAYIGVMTASGMLPVARISADFTAR
ncbi:conserved hypothetical protein [Mesorhizobium prunaredense]|uniref:Uncharacterized protein n=1 Tax=Mesorhizobium prunaredense TaxID=1631249 RepID=A0A1R3VIF0_9HYPH|nr:hypothetical protein [Mesorhizobium prunaredense]SIT59048.1 conserved hypothetical protein [Mesorhizobium prunaredense]